MAKKKKGDDGKEVVATEVDEEYGSSEASISGDEPEAMMVAQPKKSSEEEASKGFPEKDIVDEIAQTVSDGESARQLAEHARKMAPGWKPAKKFLNQRLKSGSRPEWLKLPETYK